MLILPLRSLPSWLYKVIIENSNFFHLIFNNLMDFWNSNFLKKNESVLNQTRKKMILHRKLYISLGLDL